MPTSSVTKHHAEWLSLIEISGPFLSLTSLGRVFPNELDTIDPQQAAELRSAYQEWLADQNDPAIHRAWIQYVLQTILGWEDRVLAEGQAIPEPLKYTADEHGGETVRPSYLLHNPRHPDQPRALITVYTPSQGLERAVTKALWSASPATRMLSLLHATGITLGIVTNGEQWMLVNAPKDGTAGYISWYADLWNDERLTLRAFTSLLCARRFFGVADEDTLEAMLRESADDVQEVTDQLGLQVRHAVEILVRRLDRVDQETGGELLKGVSEAKLYESALTVMMRLVFLFSAEERGLFLLGDPMYDQNYAVSTLRAQLHEAADRSGEEVLGFRSDAWSRLLATFRMVFAGAPHEDMKLPAYGGSLFDPDRFPFLEGRPEGSRWDRTTANPPAVDNRTVLHLLDALQVLQTKGEVRRLSFRALDIEQIGHVYEGLLDHQAIRAAETILGFTGGVEPEIALSDLESASNVTKFLKEATGRSSESPIKRAMSAPPDGERLRRLYAACGDDDLAGRVMPYLNLLRHDEFGYPLVIHAGSAYVTAGTERRATGTHYTPKSLTEPIVEHTLEPVIYIGPAEGLPRDQWQLKSARELLGIKVCDMAMGSGAFLVQACRYLGERLVEAWTAALASQGDPTPRLTVDGEPPAHTAGELLIPDDPDERIITAQRLIADRCLYGVDKNPLAVEMAKLSLWLVTLAKGRPFTFLDHALKCGDSLLGVSLQQLKAWALDAKADDVPLFRIQLQSRIDEMIQLRLQLEGFTVNDVTQQREKEYLFNEVEMRAYDLRVAADMLISAYLVDGLNDAKRDALRLRLLQTAMGSANVTDADRALLTPVMERYNPFHWELEFPEVFSVGGFNAFVGNPPFMGRRNLRQNLGDDYREGLETIYPEIPSSADFCVHFFLRAYHFICPDGSFGLIGSNTISQGVTREIGLASMLTLSGKIYWAVKNQYWPGKANVVVSLVCLHKSSQSQLECILDYHSVTGISTHLEAADSENIEAVRLLDNANKSFQGYIPLGDGFLISSVEANRLIFEDAKNSDVLFPFYNGRILYESPTLQTSQWAIFFGDMSIEEASEYTHVFELLHTNVFLERQNQGEDSARRTWWKFWRTRPELRQAIAGLDRMLAIAFTSATFAVEFVSTDAICSNALVVFALPRWAEFSLIQSSIHYIWATHYGSTMKTDPRYTPTKCFQTFPFPTILDSLEQVGERYRTSRLTTMQNLQEGLTATYNRFHDPNERSGDIAQLRALHVEMDHAVAAAYGWSDFDVKYDFHETPQGVRYTMPEVWRREVLKRLLALNFERAAEEQAMLAGAVKVKKKGKKSAQAAASAPVAPDGDPLDPNAPPPEQLDLFDDGSAKQGRLL